MAHKTALRLLLSCALISSAMGTLSSQSSYIKLRIPGGYLQARNGEEEKAYGTKADCAFGCTLLGEAECTTFHFRQDKCTLGTLNTTDPYIPSYVMDGTDVMVKPDKVSWEAVTNVTHLGFFGTQSTADFDDALHDDSFPPLPMPRIPKQKSGTGVFGYVHHKDGIITCGGLVGSTVIKKCWYWTFYSGFWYEMPGTLFHGHYYGQAVIVGDKIWMFMGKPTLNGAPHKKVESYDMKLGHWSEEPEADVQYGVSYFQAVVYDETKVRFFRPIFYVPYIWHNNVCRF